MIFLTCFCLYTFCYQSEQSKLVHQQTETERHTSDAQSLLVTGYVTVSFTVVFYRNTTHTICKRAQCEPAGVCCWWGLCLQRCSKENAPSGEFGGWVSYMGGQASASAGLEHWCHWVSILQIKLADSNIPLDNISTLLQVQFPVLNHLISELGDGFNTDSLYNMLFNLCMVRVSHSRLCT